jgi:hypothetical protein
VDRYNPVVAWRLAVFSAVQGKLDEADGYYTAAARLWPTNSLLWREWAYFAFSRRGDPLSAYLRVTRSLWFDPLAPAARELQQLALSQLGFRLGR